MGSEILASLRTVLANLYPDESSIRRIIVDCGISLPHIILNSSAINNWHSVLTEAEKIGRVDALLGVVELEYGNNKEFRNACDIYRQSTDHSGYSQNRDQDPKKKPINKKRVKLLIWLSFLFFLLVNLPFNVLYYIKDNIIKLRNDIASASLSSDAEYAFQLWIKKELENGYIPTYEIKNVAIGDKLPEEVKTEQFFFKVYCIDTDRSIAGADEFFVIQRSIYSKELSPYDSPPESLLTYDIYDFLDELTGQPHGPRFGYDVVDGIRFSDYQFGC